MIIQGFTGTSAGLAILQEGRLVSYMTDLFYSPESINIAVHGGCDGGDDAFHEICVKLGVPIEIFPSPKQAQKSWPGDNVLVHPVTPGTPLNRNHKIVARATQMVACPWEEVEQIRSGTWATVRYTRAARKPLVMIYPNGSIVPV